MSVSRVVAKTDIRKALSKEIVSLYRAMCRDIPRVLLMYNLENQTVSEARHMLLLQFRKQSHVTDPRLIEILLANAKMEYEETMQQWKQKAHVQEFFEPMLAAPDMWTDYKRMNKSLEAGEINERDIWADWNRKKLRNRTNRVFGQLNANPPANWDEELRIQGLLAKLAQPAAESKMQ